jgi:hypothetical protein
MDNASTKPKYLGTLNAVAVAEADAGCYLRAWADVTPDPDLRCALQLVAARETSHGDIFCRRIAELGFELRRKDDPDAAARLARYGSTTISDLEKVGPENTGSEPDPFANIEQQLAEGLYDPLTALLMRWYIAEERDSGRILREAYGKVRACAKVASNGASGATGDAQAIMACMTAGFDRVEKAILRMAER